MKLSVLVLLIALSVTIQPVAKAQDPQPAPTAPVATPSPTPTPQPRPTPAPSAEVLPGKGLAQPPFLYCGEWDTRKPEQTMFIIRDGKVVWSYSIPNEDELDDCSQLSKGNIIFARKAKAASEITPRKNIACSYEALPLTAVHSAHPIREHHVLMMRNAHLPKL